MESRGRSFVEVVAICSAFVVFGVVVGTTVAAFVEVVAARPVYVAVAAFVVAVASVVVGSRVSADPPERIHQRLQRLQRLHQRLRLHQLGVSGFEVSLVYLRVPRCIQASPIRPHQLQCQQTKPRKNYGRHSLQAVTSPHKNRQKKTHYYLQPAIRPYIACKPMLCS